MGHREDLLAGAKACLVDKGFADTTARDIVAASNTNLASIGYHFGSKEALLTEAMIAVMAEWGDNFARAAAATGAAHGEARFQATWQALLGLFASDRRMLAASYEIAARATRVPELQGLFADAWEQARSGLAEDFIGDAPLDEATRRAVGSVLLALISGIGMQALLDPEGAPDASAIARAMRAIGAALADDAA